MHYNPLNNVVRRMQCTGNIFKRCDVQGEDRLKQVKLDHSFTQQGFTEGLLWARDCRLSKPDRIPLGTYRSTRQRDIKHKLQKTITRIIRDMMKYRMLRVYKRGHLPYSEGRGRKQYVRSLVWECGGTWISKTRPLRRHLSNSLLCSHT